MVLCLSARLFSVMDRPFVQLAVNYRQLYSKRLLMNACTFIKTFCSCSDTRNWYKAFSFYANRSVMA